MYNRKAHQFLKVKEGGYSYLIKQITARCFLNLFIGDTFLAHQCKRFNVGNHVIHSVYKLNTQLLVPNNPMTLRLLILAKQAHSMEKKVNSLRKNYSFRNKKTKLNCDSLKQDERDVPGTTEGGVNENALLVGDDVSTKFQNLEQSPSSNKKTKPTNSGKRKRPIKISYNDTDTEADNGDKWEPDNWKHILENIREMRKSMDAPVDTMGCDVSYDLNLPPEVRRYHVLISLMLSSQTKDEVNFATMKKLREHGLTIDNILNTDDNTLGMLIKSVGFWKTKVKYIRETTRILKNKFNCDIPKTVEELCTLPGVGPKMAHLAMNCGWGIVTGIGVDVHVHRISNRLQWVRKPTKTPEATRCELESWLPKEFWKEVNHLLVGFGQTICRSKPDCSSCLNKSVCPASLVK